MLADGVLQDTVTCMKTASGYRYLQSQLPICPRHRTSSSVLYCTDLGSDQGWCCL